MATEAVWSRPFGETAPPVMPRQFAMFLPFSAPAYNPMADSRAPASGMWQFSPGTGRDYKLKQDWWRDERRDVIAKCLELGVPIFNGRIDKTLFLTSLREMSGSAQEPQQVQAAGA